MAARLQILKIPFGRMFVRTRAAEAHGKIIDFNNLHPGADKTAKMWKNLTLFVAVPAVLLAMVNAYLMTKEEEKTVKRPEFIKYDYMYIRNKRFPWGDGSRTLFHNPHRNALPDIGYEAEEEHHH